MSRNVIKRAYTLNYAPFGIKHRVYINNAQNALFNVAEGAIRAGKTIDNCLIACMYLETCEDKIHLASGSTLPNAKLNIGDCNGFGLEHLFRGRCRWGKYKENHALYIQTLTGEKVVIFVGGGKADSYKKILGNSYGLWIATEINEHFDSDDSRISFIKVALGRQIASKNPKIIWDLNPCNPKHPIYRDYIDKFMGVSQDNNLNPDDYLGDKYYKGGYQYMKFTLNDNLSIDEERRKAISNNYVIGSVWYNRDILGQRVVAQGLIYEYLIDNLEKYMIEKEVVKELIKYKRDIYIDVGLDFGGNKSFHALTATLYVENTFFVLKSIKIKAKDTSIEYLINQLDLFCKEIVSDYGFIDGIYCDHMNLVVNSINQQTNYPAYLVNKLEIKERIYYENTLINQERIYFVKNHCDDLLDGLSTAIYDEKQAQMGNDVRKDTDSTENDCIDSWEYSFMRRIGL